MKAEGSATEVAETATRRVASWSRDWRDAQTRDPGVHDHHVASTQHRGGERARDGISGPERKSYRLAEWDFTPCTNGPDKATGTEDKGDSQSERAEGT